MAVAPFLTVYSVYRSQFVAKPEVILKNSSISRLEKVKFYKTVLFSFLCISNGKLTAWPQTSHLLEIVQVFEF